ncbi:FtsX-like permease family protein [Breznakia pachnodae]|uniref:ABC transport system permease protein n=1 Tax=Breznakia pachnodae TaxID=265178 RepID=A0ABU0E8Q8_9FIRM|nr:FtsX-like permease family protein [Breznakia pachnodae]MDQ0363286.1 putative ABC transport system permease protein [Breznakia pachnodae]
MKKRALNKDLRKSFTKSIGRFISIASLMALGSFALVGLMVTGPNMRTTATNYFDTYNLSDLTIMSDYGLDESDTSLIDSYSELKDVEYGYLKDVTIKDSDNSFRIFSQPETISKYELIDGKLPTKDNEIAITNEYADQYKIGDTIVFDEKEDITGNKVLKKHKFKVVGYINSSEILSSVNLGATTAGTGDLKGFAIVNEAVFDSDIYMIARMTFTDTEGIDPYSDEYTNIIQNHKDELASILIDQPSLRFASIKDTYQSAIDTAQQTLDDAKTQTSDAKEQLDEAKNQIDTAKDEISSNEQLLNEAEATITENENLLNQKVAEYQSKLTEYQDAVILLNDSRTQLQNSKTELDTKQVEIDTNKTKLENAKLSYESTMSGIQSQINDINSALQNPNLTAEQIAELNGNLTLLQAGLDNLTTEYNSFIQTTYNPGMAGISDATTLINQKWNEYNSAYSTFSEKETLLANSKVQLDDAALQISEGQTALASAKEELSENKSKLEEAKTTLAESEETYNSKKTEYDNQIDDINKEIEDGTTKLSDAKEMFKNLKEPVYSYYNRREIPGAEGYKIYSTVSKIIDSLAKVFPIFLYFVAALVTFTTMTRFVDDERINMGTLKALGYGNRDIIKKFTLYGLIASFVGTLIGVALGHTLLPAIVYDAYKVGFALPPIELHIDVFVCILAFVLALISAVLPAHLVARKALKEKTSSLLLPKAPADGSKIFLERIKPLWNRLSFTHKVTARNIFRYKKRMLMTIFGVCGSVALIFTGFSVQHSIAGVGERQFDDIINYDMIVAENDFLTESQSKNLDSLLKDKKVDHSTSIYYEELSTISKTSKDKQSIKLIVPNDNKQLEKDILLNDRKSNDTIKLNNDGAIISERLASLMDVSEGDTITLQDPQGNDVKLKVEDITEMYIGHFVFVSQDYYKDITDTTISNNAYLVTLQDHSKENVETWANNFMTNEGVKGVVQNTTLSTQIDTIVKSLDKIMTVLIVVAIMLAVVILYNLTNINVSERIRELSTIKVLGFYDKEVTMYIYRETIVLSILGILAGYVFGIFLHSYILNVVPPDDVMFNPELWLNAFIIPVIVIGITLAILGVYINKKLQHVDMLEALKSVD